MNNHPRINWDYKGKPDFINGTGAYSEEKLLGYGTAFIIPTLLFIFVLTDYVNWSILQMTVAFLIAFDVSGGIISNSLNSGKRFYHSAVKAEEGRQGYIFKNKWIFSAFHIHPLVVSLLFTPGSIAYGLFWYPVFMVSAAFVITVPLYLKRPVSMLTILLAILLNQYVIAPIHGFEWLMPLLFLKIIYGHLVREEPYRKMDTA